METESTPVLVVGGSLVGLSAAVFLSWRGVRTVLVEPHLGSSPHPRAIGYTQRTMELFHTAGLTAQIPQVPPGMRLRRARVESLAGEWREEVAWTPQQPKQESVEYSPHTGAAIAQDRLEPILRDKAQALGADLRLGTEFVRFEQDENGVTAWLRERGGREYTLRASYMITADGSRSSVREALGIGRQGPGHLQTMRSVLFRAPLDEYLAKGVSQFEISQPDLDAFLATYADGRWVLMFKDDEERDQETLLAALRKAIGRSDVPIELITTGRWELAALIADRFTAGRVFLAGDAAHTLPPTRGGFGANTGIQDVHNLAWKLASVLSGTSTPKLLETYEQERRPVAWVRMEQTFARPDYSRHGGGFAQGVAILDEAALELGQIYRSAAVIGAGEELPAAARPDEWNGQPGTRAPHLWVEKAGKRLSTLELLERGWVLLAEDARWSAAAAAASGTVGIPVESVRIGTDISSPEPQALRAAFGIGTEGASLIRPDGYIAWRAKQLSESPARALTDALARASCASAH